MGVLESRHQLILLSGVYRPAIFVDEARLLILLENEMFLPMRRRCWVGCYSSQFGQIDKGGGFKSGVFLRHKNKPEVSVMSATDGDLD